MSIPTVNTAHQSDLKFILRTLYFHRETILCDRRPSRRQVIPKQMALRVFTELPVELPRLVCVIWLPLKYVVRLDSAFCDQKLRKQFLTLAYGQFTTYETPSFDDSTKLEPIMRWTISRGAQLSSVCVNGSGCSNERLLPTFLAMSGSAIRRVDSCCSDTNAGVNHQKLLQIARWCPNVQQLHVQSKRSSVVWDDCISKLTGKFHQLLGLALLDVQISTRGLTTALTRCKCLQTLRVRTANVIVPVEFAIPTLRSIRIHGCYTSDAVLIKLGQRCVKLETLEVCDGKYLITDVGVSAVLQGCPLLRETDIAYAAGISNELRVELAKRGVFRLLNLFR
jgi:hypothetical protein